MIKLVCKTFAFILLTSHLAAQASTKDILTVSLIVGEPQAAPDFQNWFNSFFETTPPNHEITPTSDYDGDGQFDYFEYFAGTDPTDGSSKLKIIETFLSGEDAEIVWSSVPNSSQPMAPGNRFYRVFRCGPDSLGNLADPNATIEILQSNNSIVELTESAEIASQGETTSYTDVNAKSQFPLFYRVFLSKPQVQQP